MHLHFRQSAFLWAQKTEAGVRFNTESMRSDAWGAILN